jgi:hypothetical protein
MKLCHSILWPAASIASLCLAFSWIYWLRKIYFEVKGITPENERLEWMRSVSVPPEIHRVWGEHVKLFPKSRKRSYAALSFLLFFLVPIAVFTGCLLVSGTVP